jgi:hypothetical protein
VIGNTNFGGLLFILGLNLFLGTKPASVRALAFSLTGPLIMRQLAALSLPLILPLLLLTGCGPTVDVIDLSVQSDYVTLAVQATDKFGRPIEGVQVRILEAWQEFDNQYYPARGPNRIRSTGPRGRVIFDAYDLGQSGLGFATTTDGDAILYSAPNEDEALVTVEIGSSTLGWIEVDIPLTYALPYNEVLLEY